MASNVSDKNAASGDAVPTTSSTADNNEESLASYEDSYTSLLNFYNAYNDVLATMGNKDSLKPKNGIQPTMEELQCLWNYMKVPQNRKLLWIICKFTFPEYPNDRELFEKEDDKSERFDTDVTEGPNDDDFFVDVSAEGNLDDDIDAASIEDDHHEEPPPTEDDPALEDEDMRMETSPVHPSSEGVHSRLDGLSLAQSPSGQLEVNDNEEDDATQGDDEEITPPVATENEPDIIDVSSAKATPVASASQHSTASTMPTIESESDGEIDTPKTTPSRKRAVLSSDEEEDSLPGETSKDSKGPSPKKIGRGRPKKEGPKTRSKTPLTRSKKADSYVEDNEDSDTSASGEGEIVLSSSEEEDINDFVVPDDDEVEMATTDESDTTDSEDEEPKVQKEKMDEDIYSTDDTPVRDIIPKLIRKSSTPSSSKASELARKGTSRYSSEASTKSTPPIRPARETINTTPTRFTRTSASRRTSDSPKPSSSKATFTSTKRVTDEDGFVRYDRDESVKFASDSTGRILNIKEGDKMRTFRYEGKADGWDNFYCGKCKSLGQTTRARQSNKTSYVYAQPRHHRDCIPKPWK